MKEYIYADNAATTKLDIEAFEAMKPFLLDNYGNASQPYSFSCSVKAALKNSRSIIAECINAEPEEIYFTSGGTESDNWAIKGVAYAEKDKTHIISDAIEHHAVLKTCEFLERLGHSVKYLTPQSDGVITPDNLRNHISRDTKLVSIMTANNEIGTIQPIKELCAVAHSAGALFHTDAVQAIGHIKIDVKELGVDMLSASAHKFNGPKGVGFLYIKKDTPIVSYENGGAQEFGMRAGTENVASIVGMAVALQNNCKKINKTFEYKKSLANKLEQLLHSYNIDYIRNGSNDSLPGLLNLSFKNCDGEMLLHRLDLMGIAVSTGAACNSKDTVASHVLQAINVPTDYINGTIRISLGDSNTDDDVIKIANALNKIIKTL
jgi:cysteine desulfurase